MTDLAMQEGVPYNATCGVTISGVSAATPGYTARLKIAHIGVVVLELVEGAGITTTARDGGVDVVFSITAAQADAFEHLHYDYQLDLLLDGVVVLRPLIGMIVVEPDVVSG